MKKRTLTAFLISIVFLTTTFFAVLILLYTSYIKWERNFETNLNIQNTVYTGEYVLGVDEKINQFISDSQTVSFIELTPKETVYLLSNTIQNFLREDFKILQIYVEPSDSVWKIYLKLQYKEKISFWIGFDLNKDERETAELYTKEIYVMDVKIKKIFNTDIPSELNKGISQGLITANENGFTERYLENIELKEDKIIIKGSKY